MEQKMNLEYHILLEQLRKYPLSVRQSIPFALKNYLDQKNISMGTLVAVFYPEKKEISMLDKVKVGSFVARFSKLSSDERIRLLKEVSKPKISEKIAHQINRFIESKVNDCLGNFRTRNM